VKLNLEKRVVLITGAASGIGRASSYAFASEGAQLALLDHDSDQLIELATDLADEGSQVATAVADLSTADAVTEGVNTVLQAYEGTVDVLVNKVGQCRARTFDELNDQDWLATFEVNFLSAVRAIRCVLPTMRAAQRGCIITNASDLARQPEAAPADYQVSKVGLLSLTKSLALSEGPHIRVNAVAPGPIWTPLWTRPGGFADTLGNLHDRQAREAVEHELSKRQLPLQRMGTPEEVATVMVFLASDAASFVTGSVWGVDGGSIRGLL
jgi:NAD(P)-dependent dehydrogenase (short-subunit alcohol dehydrogenase family)